MSWDATNRWIVGPVSIGDVSTATGTASGDLGTLCTSPLINPLALWKPFRNPNPGFASIQAQRDAIKAARCGFLSGTYGLPSYFPMQGSGLDIPHAVWSYGKPRGFGGGAAGAHEYYRITDFSPVGNTVATGGYYPDAVAPFGVMFQGGSISAGSNAVVFLFDQNTYSLNGGRWRANYCMSFDDVVPASVYGNYKFALVFQSSRGTSVVVSGTTVTQAASTKMASVVFDAEDVTAIPITAGQTVACAMCLVSSSWAEGVYNGSSEFNDYVLSLELTSGCDRQILTFRGAGSITDMEGHESRVFTRTNEVYPGIGKKFTIDLLEAILTAGPYWGNLDSVDIRLEYRCLGTNMLFGDDNGHPMGDDPRSGVFYFSVPLTAGQEGREYTLAERGVNGFMQCIYLMPNTGRGLYDIILTAIHGSEELRLTYYAYYITYDENE